MYWPIERVDKFPGKKKLAAFADDDVSSKFVLFTKNSKNITK